MAEPEKAPSLREILDRYEWHQDAACYGEPDPRTFFPESNYRTPPGPRELLPLLICQGCPVRRTCLREAYSSWEFDHGEVEQEIPGTVERRYRGLPDSRLKTLLGSVSARGVWGATTELERYAVGHLPTEEAIEVLDRDTEQRIDRRIERYLAAGPHRGPRRVIGRIDAMLEERGRAKQGSPATRARERRSADDRASV